MADFDPQTDKREIKILKRRERKGKGEQK